MTYADRIAPLLNISSKRIQAVIELLEGGATVPFIARYRKETTGSLDEVEIADIQDWLKKLQDLDKRREVILESISQQGKLTPALRKAIEAAATMTELEDLYLPYRQKRKTRASVAIERGLEPLAKRVLPNVTGKWRALRRLTSMIRWQRWMTPSKAPATLLPNG